MSYVTWSRPVTESWGLTVGVSIVAGAWLGWPAVPVMLAAILALQVIRGQWNLLMLAVATLMVLLGIGRAELVATPVVPDNLASSTAATVTIESFPRLTSNGASLLATVSGLEFDGEPVPTEPFTVLLTVGPGFDLAPGDQVSVRWSVSTIEELGPGYGQYIRAQGADATAFAWNVVTTDRGPRTWHLLVDVRNRVSNGLQEALPGDAGALAAGIVTGDDTRLSDQAVAAFRRTGTTHITAVSGSNVAMVLAIWYLLMPTGRTRRFLVIQALIIASIWVYAVLVGLEPPAVRAALMATLIIVGSRFGRRPDPLTILALTSAAMVLWNPLYVEMVSFWLSVVASAAIFSRVPAQRGGSTQAAVRDMASGVVLAQVATLPIVIAVFGAWSVGGILANLLLAPLMWLAFPLSFALAFVVLVAPWIAGLAGIFSLVPLQLALSLVSALASAVPPVNLQNAGAAAVVGISLPSILLALLLVRDTHRWAPLALQRWKVNPQAMVVAVAGPAIGAAVALLAIVTR